MARPRRFSPCIAIVRVRGLWAGMRVELGTGPDVGRADSRRRHRAASGRATAGIAALGYGSARAVAVKLKEPGEFRVYQRDITTRPISRSSWMNSMKDGKLVSAVIGPEPKATPGSRSTRPSPSWWACRSGGRTRSSARSSSGIRSRQRRCANVFVGDLWVLAGQSNMEGVGDLVDVTPSKSAGHAAGHGRSVGRSPKSRCTGSSIRRTRSIRTMPTPGRPARHRPTRLARRAPAWACRSPWRWWRRPACRSAWWPAPMAEPAWNSGTRPRKSRGATASMARCCARSSWPAARSRACSGIRARATALAGRGVEGVSPGRSAISSRRCALTSASPSCHSISSRSAGSSRGADPKGWNAVQDTQRTLPERVPNTAVVSVIDLELDDGIHVGTQGLKRAGQRLARVALRELFGQSGATTPTLDRVTRGPEQHAGAQIQRREHEHDHAQDDGRERPRNAGMSRRDAGGRRLESPGEASSAG